MAARWFREAIAQDDLCAMAWWGLTYSSGIYYNKPWHRMQADELVEKLQLTDETSRAALQRIDHVTRVEAMLIEAMQARYQSPTPVSEAELHRWDDDYADAMPEVYEAFSDDNDVCALHAEALMTRTPWALWSLRSGEPSSGASTQEAIDVLKIAEQMLLGEIEYRRQNHEVAYDHLRQAVYLDDNLKYDEPWGWMQPARHAPGALLLEQGHVDKAEQVYRDDLGLSDTLASTSRHHDNLWSLHGLVECLERKDLHDQARRMRARLNLAKARADVPILASCACRMQHHCCEN